MSKPPAAPEAWPEDDEPATIGAARMEKDGTLVLNLRTVAANGTIGEATMLVGPKDKRHADMVKHLGGIQPGQVKPIPPFPAAKVDPDEL